LTEPNYFASACPTRTELKLFEMICQIGDAAGGGSNTSKTPNAEDGHAHAGAPGPRATQHTPTKQNNGQVDTTRSSAATKKLRYHKKLTWLNIPYEVWRDIVCGQFINFKNRSLLRPTSKFFESVWQDVVKLRKISVPIDCSSIVEALVWARTLSQRLKRPGVPFRILLGSGEHDMPVRMHTTINCNDIVLMGQGPDRTTINGGFRINGHTGIGFHNLSISNRWGSGLSVCGKYRKQKTGVVASNCRFHRCVSSGISIVGPRAKVYAVQCEILQTIGNGISCVNAAKARLIDCTIHNNDGTGISAMNCNTQVHIRGKNTSIHQNDSHGMYLINFATVCIFLPSSHITARNNGSKNIETKSSVSFVSDGEVLYREPHENDHKRYLVLKKALKRLESGVY